MSEEREIIFGVYFHPKKGFAIAEPGREPPHEWEIDKNKHRSYDFFGYKFKLPVYEAGTGSYFFYRSLRGYDYIGEF